MHAYHLRALESAGTYSFNIGSEKASRKLIGSCLSGQLREYQCAMIVRSDGARSSPSLSIRWDTKLPRPLQVRHGPKLETLADVSRLIAKLPWRYQRHQAWISATELLMTAAERGNSIESATEFRSRARSFSPSC